tara:strand:- start:201 stop:1238 length:1038 start_codon:yes stop_codon:yes gene_type:complete
MTILRGQMPRQLYEVGSTPPSMEKMIQTIMEMTGVSREEAIRIIQTMENPQETMDDATVIQEGYKLDPRSDMQDGGIMNVIPRQKYGFGSIVKSVTKAVKGVAKGVSDVVSSDAGKLALLAAGGYYLGGGQIPGIGKFLPQMKYGSAAGTGFGFGNILPNVANIAGFTGTAEKLATMGTLGKTALGIGGSSLLAGIFGTEEEAQELYARDPAEFNARVKQYTKNLNPKESEEVLKQIQSDIAALGDVKKAEQVFTRNVAAEGGIMGIPTGEMRQNQQGVTELDYRQDGGFVPIGIKEKADDVPAMLSKNEFVMTADAVRGAGNGDIEKGAQKMYNTMKQLESRVV